MVYRRKAAQLRPGNGKGKLRLLTRDALDGRTRAAKQFDAIASAIASDLGGLDRCSEIQKNLIEAFAGVAVHVRDLNAHMVLGETIDLAEHAQAVTTLVRVASRLPINRIAKDVTTLGQLIREDQERERQRLAQEHEARRQANEAAE